MTTTNNRPVIGWVGLGKLGTPLAVSIASRGFRVLGHDVNPQVMRKQTWPYRENGPDGITPDFQQFLDAADLHFLPLSEVMAQADLVFVAVQTPHEPEYEGITRVPRTRADFNYRWLIEACAQVAKHRRPGQPIAVVSTVLPGTMRRDILPLLPDLVYNPAFPAMGTVLRDFLYPEFVLMGGDDPVALGRFERFYKQLYALNDNPVPIQKVAIESAELTKVVYNTFITMKITAITTAQEIAHKVPRCNIDEVSDTLALATRRICSPAYLRGGVGDAGACHPRDCIAMSWLAEKLKLSNNLFDNLMLAREWQAEWLADLLCSHGHAMPKVILGKAYKPESAITAGSCGLLIANILSERGVPYIHYDPFVDNVHVPSQLPAAYLVMTRHGAFRAYPFAAGSIVIDPFRYLEPQTGVRIVPVGVG